jgi:hypothetical protein
MFYNIIVTMLERTINNPNYETINQETSIYSKLNRKYKLPKGWVELFDTKTNKVYYACNITKHTQWLHPNIPIGIMMSNGLPYGWDIGFDKETNKVYYINNVGRFNTWNPPIKHRSYKGEDYIW